MKRKTGIISLLIALVILCATVFVACGGKVVIPDTVTTLQNNVFDSSGVRQAVIGSSIHRIPEGLFASCTSLEYVTLRSAHRVRFTGTHSIIVL